MNNNSKSPGKNLNPLKFSIKFSNTVFVLGILYSFLIVTFSVYKIYYTLDVVNLKFYYLFIIFGGIFALLFGFGLKLNIDLKINIYNEKLLNVPF